MPGAELCASQQLEIPAGVVDDVQLGRAVDELNKFNKVMGGGWRQATNWGRGGAYR